MDNIIKYYSSFDEWGRLDREPIEYMINLHFIRKFLPEQGLILDNGAGPGKYAIELAKSGYHIVLTDLTPNLVEVAKGKAKELEVEDHFKGFHVADATNLNMLEDEQFDGALMLGPLYHLQSEVERIQALSELHRVTKKDGIVFVAFISKIRHLTTSLLFPELWKPNHNVDGIENFLATGHFNHSDEGRFTGAYYFDIEDIKPFMKDHGFECINVIASGSVVGAMKPEQWDYWRSRGQEEYDHIMEIVMKAAENPYILGASSHLLFIGRRIELEQGSED
ncbi:class I SAM-dependent methyltransferase [Paenibacillus pini]|uniref:SAM-dependent methyltransferase n=1 Tax=Paenibacillus pini JCM 16418 TaxID=1236976 RepID=W7YZ32_9BACL|nr:class I SAM-dependent methyltransferase [Paenibacillus pini]GAF07634.1 SAM-dependent methyltransferase [Paenibacillus pini JCM 16418]